MSSISELISYFEIADSALPSDVTDIEKTEFSFRIRISNVFKNHRSEANVEQFFGGAKVRVTNIENTQDIYIDVSRICIPEGAYSPFEILKYLEKNKHKGWLFGIGNYGPVDFPINDLIHGLLVGSSGYGKSSFFRFLISQTLAFQEDIVNYIVDPKQIDYKAFKEHPRVAAIAGNKDDWSSVFSLLVVEMAAREKLLSESFSTPPPTLADYHILRNKFGRSDLPDLPRIICWVDEAHIVLNQVHDGAREFVEMLAKRSRAVGIHLICATQRLTELPAEFRSQTNLLMSFFVNSAEIRHADLFNISDSFKLRAIQGRLLVANTITQSSEEIQTPYIGLNDSLSVAFGFSPKSRFHKSGLLNLSFSREVLENGILARLIFNGESINSINSEKILSRLQSRLRDDFKFTLSGLVSALQVPQKVKDKIAAMSAEHDGSNRDDRVAENAQIKIINQAIEDLKSPKTILLAENVLAQTTFEGFSLEELELIKTYWIQLTNASNSISYGDKSFDGPILIQNYSYDMTSNTPDFESLIKTFQDKYSKSEINFDWCIKDLTENTGLIKVLKYHNKLTVEEAIVSPGIDEIAIDEPTKDRISKYIAEARAAIHAGRKVPLLIISGPDGIGKNTLLIAIATELKLKVRTAKSSDILRYHGEREAHLLKMLRRPDPTKVESESDINDAEQNDVEKVLKATTQPEIVRFNDLAAAVSSVRNAGPDTVSVYISSGHPDSNGGYNLSSEVKYLKEHHIHLILNPRTYSLESVSDKLIAFLLKKHQYSGINGASVRTRQFATAGVDVNPHALNAVIERAARRAHLLGKDFTNSILKETLSTFKLDQSNTSNLVKIVSPQKSISDLLIGEETRIPIEDAIYRGKHLDQHKYIFAEKLRKSGRLICLFGGPPGTGKSMAAEVIARETGRELWIMDFNNFISPYHGQTEQLMSKIFMSAESAQAVLLLDEADAFLGARSSDQRSWERTQLNHLLNIMENFRGILILTTNHFEGLDAAFVRRIDIKVRFKNPNIEQLEKMLRAMLEPDAPLSNDFSYSKVLDGVAISGGLLRNAVERAIIKMEKMSRNELTNEIVRTALLETQEEASLMNELLKKVGIG